MIRFKVFIPVVLITALIAWFVLYRLDIFVKGTLEDTISSMTGTKTDIHRLRISLVNSRVTISRLESASKADPMKNAIEFSDIALDFQFLPILQKRFVVDNFSIVGIQWGTPRTYSGYLPPKPKSNEPSFLGELTDEAIASLKTEFDKLPVSKLTDFEIPNDPKDVLSKLDLQSVKAFKDSATAAQSMRTTWTERYKDIKDVSEIKALVAKSKALGNNLPQKPEEILKRVKEVQSVIEELEVQQKRAEKLVGDVKTDYAKIEGTFNQAKAALESDYNKAKALTGFDAVNPEALVKMIFGTQWIGRVQQVLQAQTVIRKKLKMFAAAGKDDSVQVQPRAKGRDIVFVTPKKLPSFVWAKSDFSVNVLKAGDRNSIDQKYEFKIRDVNSAPKLHGMPTTIHLGADFKEAVLSSADIDALWDYTKDISRDIYKAEVKRIKAEDWPVGIPKLFPVKITSGHANAGISFEFIGDDLTWVNDVKFSGVKWDFSKVPKSGVLVPILEKVFQDVQEFYLKLKVTLKDSKLAMDIGSDLDSRLKSGIAKVLEEKLAELQARIRREIDSQVASIKEQATKEMNKFQEEAVKRAENALSEITSGITNSNALVKDLETKAKKAVGNKVGDEIKKKAGKIKIPGIKF